MSGLINDVYHGSGSLGQAFYLEAANATTELGEVMGEFDVTPNTMYRLMKLTGFSKGDREMFHEALSQTDSSYLREFNYATAGESTWYGTYVANAFGSGIKRSFGENISEKEKVDVVKSTIRAIAVASDFHRKFGDSSYAISSVTPGLMINDGSAQLIISELMYGERLHETSECFQTNKNGLHVRGNKDAIEIGYKISH